MKESESRKGVKTESDRAKTIKFCWIALRVVCYNVIKIVYDKLCMKIISI